MKSKINLLNIISIMVLASMVMLTACATPTPETIIETVVVEVEGETIIQTVEVEVEVEVEVTAEPPEVTEAPDEDITITFWKPSWGDPDETYLPPIFAEFEAAHPGVKVEYLFHPWESLMERYITAFLSDSPPDIFYLPDLHYPKFAAAGFLTKLDEKFADDIDAVEAEQFEQWWKAGIYNENVYGVPMVHVGITLVYNKDLFDAAGLPYPPGPDDPNLDEWTWDKFIEVTQELTDAEKGQWGYGWAANWTGDAEIWMYCYEMQAGNWIVKDDFSAVGFDNENGLKAFEYMNDLVNTYEVIPDGGMNPKFQDLFLTGKAAMAGFDVYQVVGIINDHPELNIGITPYPQGPGTELLDGRGMHANVGFLYLASKSKHPEMAWELIKFMNEKENVENYVNAVGLFGTRKDYVMNMDNPEAQEIAREILSAARQFGFPNQINPKMIEIRALFVAEVQNMVQGVKTPEEAWRDAAASMNAILSQP